MGKIRNWKTTLVGLLCGLIGLSIFILYFYGKIEVQELSVALAAVGIFGTMVLGIIGKDHNVSGKSGIGSDLPPEEYDEDPV
jgi:hypothetical protein